MPVRAPHFREGVTSERGTLVVHLSLDLNGRSGRTSEEASNHGWQWIGPGIARTMVPCV